MTEEEARTWTHKTFGSAVFGNVERFVERIIAEAASQNLISATTIPAIWNRHVVDSLQLLRFAAAPSSWLDIGSGAGFPGLAIAVATAFPVTLVEPRGKRADLLKSIASDFGLHHVTVVPSKLERMPVTTAFDVISARAVASLEQLLTIAHRHASHDTLWVLPKGRSAKAEIADTQDRWRGMFHVEPSITDPDAAIVLAQQVRPR